MKIISKRIKIRTLILSLGLTLFAHSQNLAEKLVAENTDLRISDGSQFQSQASYPKFSWDVTPQYFMFGDLKVLKPEEVNHIAMRSGFICIEKAHGMRTYGAAELGAKHEAAAFKAVNPGIKVLFYFNSAYAYPFTTYSKGLSSKNINQNPELKNFLIKDSKTGELAKRGSTYFFDVLNPKFREWWVMTVAKGVADSGCDGVFIDQMHGFSWLRNDKRKEVKKSMGEMMAALKKKLGPDKIVLANNAQNEENILAVSDASMFEHFNSKLLTKEALLRDWDNMLKISKKGKMSVFRIGVEQDSSLSEEEKAKLMKSASKHASMAALAKDRLEYYQAVYLIGAQPYSYFQYGWGWKLSTGPLESNPNLMKPLGAPKGAYTRVKEDGWVFTREFEHASVWVDTEKGQGKITWK
ncbi:MAG: putative glycoside hydrolase [Akkermansiaceae bacterium]